jgi:hypothetical protein
MIYECIDVPNDNLKYATNKNFTDDDNSSAMFNYSDIENTN